MIQTSLGPQNARLNLSFVKDFNVVGKKITRNDRKTAIYESQIFSFFSYKIKKKI